MAKYRLMADHYLNVSADQYGEKIDFEYAETDSQTNRIRRRAWDVPMFIPKDSIVTTKQEDFEAYNGDVNFRPIVFKGDPTPDMQPIDDDAVKLTASFQPKWKHAIESLSGTMNGDNFSASLIAGLEKMINQASLNQQPANAPNVSTANVDSGRLAELEKKMAELMDMNLKLLAEKAGEPVKEPAAPTPVVTKPAAQAERRV